MKTARAELYTASEMDWNNESLNILGVEVASDPQTIEKNYEQLLTKSASVLSAWENRSLSLCGKVNVTNTLVSSLFVYRMMVLPSLPIKIEKQLDDMMEWNGMDTNRRSH